MTTVTRKNLQITLRYLEQTIFSILDQGQEARFIRQGHVAKILGCHGSNISHLLSKHHDTNWLTFRDQCVEKWRAKNNIN